jgi:type IV pilus assembly protein PilW
MTRARAPRGFTLIEAVITLAVSAVVLAGALAAVNEQNRVYTKNQRLRTAQATSRDALLYLERTLPLAGYGMDPALALDFQWYTGPCPAAIGTCSRDRTDDADELVFYTRNPNYWVPPENADGTLPDLFPPTAGDPFTPPKGKAWALRAVDKVGNASITIDAHVGDSFLPGQILQLACPASLNYAYVTVSTRAPAAGAYAAETASVSISLQPVVSSDPFRRQDVAGKFASLASCRVFQIDRYRLHVTPVAQGGGRFVPLLMLDDGVNAEVPLAEGVEAFQVAYVFADAAAGTAGTTSAAAITFLYANNDQTVTGTGTNRIARTAFPGNDPTASQTAYAPSSFYTYAYTSDARKTVHQANIRALKIGLVIRSTDIDPAALRANAVSAVGLLNQSALPTWLSSEPKMAQLGTDGYQRVRVETTINLPNMLVRSLPAF